MKLIHKVYPDWCNNLQNIPIDKISPPDFHHRCSQDERNKKRIQHLCQAENKQQNEIHLEKWNIIKLKSPLKFFKYFLVDHPQIKKLNFMNEEPGINNENNSLYHPFW